MIINILLVSICIGLIAFIGCCFSKSDYLFEKSYFVGLTTASICFIILLSYYIDADVNSFSFFYTTGAYQF